MSHAHTDDELVAALHVIGYEVWMIGETASRLREDDSDGVVQNALLESMLVHVRAVRDFLWGPWRGDDISRTDFDVEWDPPELDAASPLAEAKNLINKHLAHLTWDRVELDVPPAWTYLALATETIEALATWAAALSTREPEIDRTPIMAHLHFARTSLAGGLAPPQQP